MKIKIIDRYVIQEMLGPFFVGILGFVLVLSADLLFTMADLIINKGVPLSSVLQLMFFKLPSLLILTFPVSTLFGTSMALGRLSHDSELIALRTSGISLFRVSLPIIVIGFLVSALSYFTNEKIVPSANYRSSNIIREIIMKQPLPEVSENIFFKDNQNRYYYAKKVDHSNKIMEGLMVYEITEEKFPRLILAQRASFFGGNLWKLEKGVTHKYDEKGYLNYEATFDEMKLQVREDIFSYAQVQKGPQEMDSQELSGFIKMMDRGGVSVKVFLTELYLKFSVPATCLVFALIGIPLSLPSPRVGKAWGLLVTIVLMFTFYVFASVFRSLGRGGILPPALAAFTPQVSFLLLGLGLLLWKEQKT